MRPSRVCLGTGPGPGREHWGSGWYHLVSAVHAEGRGPRLCGALGAHHLAPRRRFDSGCRSFPLNAFSLIPKASLPPFSPPSFHKGWSTYPKPGIMPGSGAWKTGSCPPEAARLTEETREHPGPCRHTPRQAGGIQGAGSHGGLREASARTCPPS